MYLFLSAADSTRCSRRRRVHDPHVRRADRSVLLLYDPPGKQTQKRAQQMRDSLKVGDNITTIGGIIGDIVSIKDDSIVIETTTDRVRVEFAKFAVSTNNTAEKEAAKQKAAALAARKEQKEKEKKTKKEK